MYRSAVGGLLYLCHTRPDIAQAVGVVCKYSSDPSDAHWTAVKRIFRYLKGTTSYGISFTKGKDLKLLGYADADYAGDLDSRKSTSGYVFFLNGAPVSCSSKAQATVAQSTAEAEYVAANDAVREAVWLRLLLEELGLKQQGATLLWQDNQGAIAIAKNPESHSRTKHIDVKHHYIRGGEDDPCHTAGSPMLPICIHQLQFFLTR